MRLKALSPLIAAACAGSALAQDPGDDWSLHTVDRTTLAYTDYSNGISLAVRCLDGSLEALIAGLPPAPTADRYRLLSLQFGDEEPEEEAYFVGRDPSIAVSRLPAPLARQMRLGGQLQIVIPGSGEGGRNVRHVLTLPASATVIDQTLTTCGKPLVDPRDDIVDPDFRLGLLPGDIGWARPPRPSYPSTNYAEGYVLMTCISQTDGSLSDCETESEFPFDAGFGRAALRSTRQARIERKNGSTEPLTMGRVRFSVTFAMRSGAQPAPIPTRLRPNPRAPQ